eukprot:TRINITY_DN11681_c0_g1_i5.p1 TRINITY_DN11681_c0_g1~~TRINITY_DN11681_c0_g1_i5.p1  ORF type:complete len:722 (+),score=168.54 TRINITY_DN11681_c0_g1_i5:43-2208(+)
MSAYEKLGDAAQSPINTRAAQTSYGSQHDSGAGTAQRHGIYWEYVIVVKVELEGSDTHTSLVDRLRGADLHVQQIRSRDGDEIFIRIGATSERLEIEAERTELKIPLKDLRPNKDSQLMFSEENADLKYAALGLATFKRAHMANYESQNTSDDGCFFSSSRRQQLINSIVNAELDEGGADLDLTRMIHKKEVLFYFPLHEHGALENLKGKWIGKDRDLRRVLWQPMREIRDYFGEYVALYFSWLGFYTRWLIAPAIAGAIAFIVQVSDNFDSPVVPAYCIFMALWSTFFLEFWKREQAALAFKWNTIGVEEEEKPRPQFQGERIVNRLTGELEIVYPPWKRTAKYFFSYPAIGTLLAGVIVATLGILVLRITMSRSDSLGADLGPMLAGIINAVTIVIFDQLYLRFAIFLNDWENYRTQTEYEDALIAKNFLFQFINSYISLFYLAFVKINDPTLFGEEDECINSCVQELTYQLGSIFGVRMITQQIIEFSLPQIKIFLRQYTEDKPVQKQDLEANLPESGPMTIEEKESKLENYHGAFDDYNEMIIQFGYVTMFAAAFPLAALLAFLNNIIEIRLDAFKMCTTFKRPHYRAVEDIGTYYYILEIISAVSVITNVCLLAFTSEFLANETSAESTLSHLWVAVIAEHILFAVKFVIRSAVPDVPEEVAEAMRLADFNAKIGDKSDSKELLERALVKKREDILKQPFSVRDYADRSAWLRKYE